MAHQLAEAICELAAPPLHPSYVKLSAFFGGHESYQHLVLHIRPRHLAAGLEVAVYAGYMSGVEDDATLRLKRRGALYAVPLASSGLAQLAADLLAASPCDADGEGQLFSFLLPRDGYSPTWFAVRCDLFDPADVQASTLPPRDAQGEPFLGLSFPSSFADDTKALASAEVCNHSEGYAHRQKTLKQLKAKQARERAAAGSAGSTAPALEELDSPAEYDRKFRQLRADAMEDLTAALTTLLRHAVRYRGSIEHPAPPAPPAPAAPAAGAQAGEQAAA